MIPLVIHAHTRMLGPPVGVDTKDCGRLAIRDVVIDFAGEPTNIQYSAWQPTEAELKLLNDGAKIYVGVHGTVFPPIHVTCGTKLLAEDPD